MLNTSAYSVVTRKRCLEDMAHAIFNGFYAGNVRSVNEYWVREKTFGIHFLRSVFSIVVHRFKFEYFKYRVAAKSTNL